MSGITYDYMEQYIRNLIFFKIKRSKSFTPFGAPGGIRTPDLPVRSRTLYPTKLLVHILYYNWIFNNIQENLQNL